MKNLNKAKLEVELIPVNSWGKNVRAVVSQEIWQNLRWKFKATRYSTDLTEPIREYLICEICHEKNTDLHLHEIWKFDNEKQVQKLVGLIPICENCHNAIHFGRAIKVGLGDAAIEQLIKVNNWSDKQIITHLKNAEKLWQTRNEFNYELDLTWLQENNLVQENKIHWSWLNKPNKVYDRIGAISWAKQMLSNPNVVILDTETTGLMEGPLANKNAEVIELAITTIKGKTLYNSRFKPRFSIPPRTVEIHGIKNQDVKSSPKFAQEFQKILEIIKGKIVISYNARFDSKVIANTCKIHNIASPDNITWDCAMQIFKAYQAPYPHYSKLPNAKHGALLDCKAALELIKDMSKNKKIKITV